MALVVLDTNVVLDWLLFRDPSCAGLGAALASGAATWVATAAMHEELLHVLGRGSLDRWSPDVTAIRAVQAGARLVESAPVSALRCTDPDDQKFVDLALHLGDATCLLSRDRAVLKLARRASSAGVRIVPPRLWHGLSGRPGPAEYVAPGRGSGLR